MDISAIARIREFAHGVDRQFWFWGQDIQHHRRRLLLDYGFTRMPPPRSEGGKSMYLLELDRERGEFLCLWAFGALLGRVGDGAVFLRRGKVKPRWHAPFALVPDRYVCLRELSLGTAVSGASREELERRLGEEVRRYEGWVQERMGEEYRAQCLARWRPIRE